MMNDIDTWDFFIAHAGPDKREAEYLHTLLSKHSRVFLDSRCLNYGDDWDIKIADAQRNSKITVVLISPKTENAYYQREEIAAAIDMARQDESKHRVVPVYLDKQPIDKATIPYGLRLKHGLYFSKEQGLSNVAHKLRDLLTHVQRSMDPKLKSLPSLGEIIEGVQNKNNAEDKANLLPLELVAEGTGRAAEATYSFANALVSLSTSLLGILDTFDSRRERKRLKNLSFNLIDLEIGQISIPGSLRSYCETPSEESWRAVVSLIGGLTVIVPELIKELANERGFHFH